jgi:zinc/manganese transport system substrate-binding protein
VNRFIRSVLIVLAIGSAIDPSRVASAQEKISVVATFSVIGDLVANVAGDHVELTTLVGPGGDTELYAPTAADVPKVAKARILFMNGLNDEFEPWLEVLLKQARFAGTKVVVSRGAKVLTAENEHPTGNRTQTTIIDQHAWLDPRNGIVYVKNIADALARGDPASAEYYRNRAAAYTQELRSLDAWAHAEMNVVPAAKRRALASHDSLQYLANAFAITMISVNGWTNNTEPSAAELAKLTTQIRQERVRALFLDSITDPRAMQRIGQETGAVIGGTLYGDALSKPGGEADTYLKMIRHDVATLKAGMLLN